MNKVKKSEYGKLDLRDWIKGLIVAGLTGAIAAIYEAGTSWSFDKETLNFLLGGLIAGMLGYITKNKYSNSNDVPFTKEPKKVKRTNRVSKRKNK